MPRQYEPTKDVVACDKPRGAGKQALIRGCPNGETHAPEGCMPICRGVYSAGTMRSETSQ